MSSPVRAAGSPSLAAVAAALMIVSCLPLGARAQDGTDYTISDEEGYGIVDCMHSGRQCGQVIADSWCESHGHAHVLAYGTGSDITGSVAAARPITKIAANDVIIRCGD